MVVQVLSHQLLDYQSNMREAAEGMVIPLFCRLVWGPEAVVVGLLTALALADLRILVGEAVVVVMPEVMPTQAQAVQVS